MHPSPLAQINNQQAAETIIGGILKLLGKETSTGLDCPQNAGVRVSTGDPPSSAGTDAEDSAATAPPAGNDATAWTPILSFAATFKANKPAEELEEIFERIGNPGPSVTIQYASRVLDLIPTIPTATDGQPRDSRRGKITELLANLPWQSLPPGQQVSLAVIHAKLGDFATTETIIETAYAADPKLTDAYARVAWQVFWPQKDYERAVQWFEKDLTTESTENTENLNQIG